MRDKVTVILPTFNSSKYLVQTLDSVFAQNHAHIEVIAVDDGSTDDTVAVLNRYPQPLQIHTQRNLGPAAARNLALGLASGDFITFIDSDDIWLPGKLHYQLALMAQCPELDVCYSDFFFWRPDATGAFADPSTFADATPGDAIEATMSGWIYPEVFLDSVVHIITSMIRPRILDKVGPFDTSLATGSDLEFWLRMSQHTPMTMLRKKLALYRIHDASITFRPKARNFGYEILTAALAKYGYAAPDGRMLDKARANERLAKVSFNFGQLHWQRGDAAIACDAFTKSARHRPYWLRNRVFQALSGIKRIFK